MSALQETKGEQTVDIVFLNQFFWRWYHRHSTDHVIQKKILFIKVNIYVKDLSFLFTQLFGHDTTFSG